MSTKPVLSPLNITFAVIWSVWMTALVVYMWWVPRIVGVDIAFLASFAVVEAIAVRTNKQVKQDGVLVGTRDTLSQLATWFARRAKHEARWWQSWNAATLVLALHVSWLVARQPQTLVLQLPTFLLMAGFLGWHWLRPDTTG